jgi:Tol biopolymer transport system component
MGAGTQPSQGQPAVRIPLPPPVAITAPKPKIVYEHAQNNACEGSDTRSLFAMNPDGSGNAAIPPGSGGTTRLDPALSPSGTRVAYAAYDDHLVNSGAEAPTGDAGLDIYIENLDGSGVVRLTSGGGNRQPAWSRDGTRLAFAHTVKGGIGQTGIYTMNADGRGIAHVPTDTHSIHPLWLANGSGLLYVHPNPTPFDSNGAQIYGYSFTTNAPVPKFVISADADSSIALSPEGSTVAYSYSGLIAVATTGDGDRRLLTLQSPSNPHDINPSWSPDGKTVLFERHSDATGRCGSSNLVEVNAAGGEAAGIKALTTGIYNGRPSWENTGSPPSALP